MISKKIKWLLVVSVVLIIILLIVFFIPIYEWLITPSVVRKLQSNNDLTDILVANDGKITLLRATGKFDSLSNLLRNKQSVDCEFRFDWNGPEPLGFDCVRGKIRVDEKSSNSRLRKFEGKECQESFADLSRIWNDSDVSMTVGDYEIPLNSHDSIGDCDLYCNFWNDGVDAYISTAGVKILSWSVRDYIFDRAYASDSN